MSSPRKEEAVISNEQMMIDAFGEGYWDLPEHERFEMTLRRLLGQNVPKVSKEEAKARAENRED